MRIGIGYDVHRLVTGRRLVLGGVVIPFEKEMHDWFGTPEWYLEKTDRHNE